LNSAQAYRKLRRHGLALGIPQLSNQTLGRPILTFGLLQELSSDFIFFASHPKFKGTIHDHRGTERDKISENRVGLTEAGVKQLVLEGHTVYVQKDAGLGSRITNDDTCALAQRC